MSDLSERHPPLPVRGRRERLAALLRPWLEAVGIDWLSFPGLHGLDRKLAALLPRRNGFFVEAGANDGIDQSNTYYLERFRGWQGLLIEPFPHLAALCRSVRTRSSTVCCALGPPEKAGTVVRLRHAGLMSHVEGAMGDEEGEIRRASQGQAAQGMPVHEWMVEAPVRTLTQVLDDAGVPPDFDLLSLDVEGYEVEVLQGLDLARYRPQAICVEVRDHHAAAVEDLLKASYKMEAVLHRATEHADYFWRRR
ncbi:MAG: FkbM family methyltransferase [Verrucomicrobiaceae bacterium]|jgi:FkbM family methyltransferase|nr:FkbM family methyltransferase [Verrucomicrobiaceae bacterium]